MTQASTGDGAAEFFDIRGKTSPLVVSEEPEWPGSFGDMRKKTRVALFAMRAQLHENHDTGWKIGIGRKGIEKALSEGQSTAHFRALEKLPELLRNAVLVRKSVDRKGRKNVNAYYRFYAPIRIGGTLYAAQITVSEDTEGERHFYLQRLQIKKPAVLRGVGNAQAHVAALRPAGYAVSIPRLLRDVNSEDAPDNAGALQKSKKSSSRVRERG